MTTTEVMSSLPPLNQNNDDNQSPTIFISYAYSIGKHQENQDSYTYGDQFMIVADGVGGTEGGGLAAHALTDIAYTSLMVYPEIELIDIVRNFVSAVYETTSTGHTTVTMVRLNGNRLETYNLGDSGYMVLRAEGKGYVTIYRSTPMQHHKFNCPYQIGFGSGDNPDHGQTHMLPVEIGDIVILGSDGVFDNLFDTEIRYIMSAYYDNWEQMANAIGQTALARSKTKCRTPFELAAKKAGKLYKGGKTDDITVVVGMICETP